MLAERSLGDAHFPIIDEIPQVLEYALPVKLQATVCDLYN